MLDKTLTEWEAGGNGDGGVDVVRVFRRLSSDCLF